jgi:hypothetical protein
MNQVQENEEQTIHVVVSDNRPASEPPRAADTSRPRDEEPLHGHLTPPGLNPGGLPNPRTLAGNAARFHHQHHQNMLNRTNQMLRGNFHDAMNASFRDAVNAMQRDRAAAGLNGIQDGAAPAGQPPAEPQNTHTHTFVRETVGPDGQHWRVTVNETVAAATPPPANGSLLGRQAPSVRSTLGHNPRPVTSSRNGSRMGTPDLGLGFGQPSLFHRPTRTPAQGPEVYILSSETGPRALLINGNQEQYVSPPMRSTPSQPPLPFPQLVLTPNAPFQIPRPPTVPPGLPRDAAPPQDILERWQQAGHQVPPPADGQRQAPAAQGQQVQAQAAIGQALPPNNPAAGALAAIWPHLWLVFRLILGIWWFTSPEASWSRWISVVCVAIGVFLVNTGVLDGLAAQAWGPFRRHLEGLLRPAGDPDQRAAGQDGNANGALPAGFPANAGAGVPDPAAAAARLLAERRDRNANWLMDQVRRMERAGLLFLASIAPGVAERHIAHLEAEVRAEEERQRRAREAAEAEAAAAAAAASGEGEGQDAATSTEAGTGREQHSPDGENGGNGQAPPGEQLAQPPLINV